MKLFENFFISLLFILLLPSAYAMQGNQVTFQQASPGINVTTKNHSIIVQLANDVSENSKTNFAALIYGSEKFFNKFKNRYVEFSGLNDGCVLLINRIFPKLLQNNVHCIVINCSENSELDKLLEKYYEKKPQSISVYRDAGASLTEWIENSQYHRDMLSTIVLPELDFSENEFDYYDKNSRADQQSFIEYGREHP